MPSGLSFLQEPRPKVKKLTNISKVETMKIVFLEKAKSKKKMTDNWNQFLMIIESTNGLLSIMPKMKKIYMWALGSTPLFMSK